MVRAKPSQASVSIVCMAMGSATARPPGPFPNSSIVELKVIDVTTIA